MAKEKKTAKKAKAKTAENNNGVEGNANVFESVKHALGNGGSVPDLQPEDYFHAHTYGIPIRNYLPLCRLIGADVLPLSRAFTIVGQQETAKSSMGWFLVRLVLKAGGFCIFIDTEHKTSYPLVKSILDLDWDPFADETRRIFAFKARTKEDAQDYVYGAVSEYYDEIDNILSGGQQMPMIILYDSLKAGESKKVLEAKEQGEDNMGRRSQQDAMYMQRTLNSSISGFIQAKPIVFVGINHSNVDEYGRSYEAGGSFKDFAWSGNLEMMKPKPGSGIKHQEQRANRNRMNIRIGTKKASLNEKQMEPIPMQMEQRVNENDVPSTRFLWDKFLAFMLEDKVTFPRSRTSKYLAVEKHDAQRFYCNKLGIKSDDPVSPEVVGGILNNSPKWQDIFLRKVFHIEPGGVYHNGIIYKPVQEHKELPNKSGKLNGLEVKYVREPPVRVVAENFWPEGSQDKQDAKDEQQVREYLESEKASDTKPEDTTPAQEKGDEESSGEE